VTLERRARAAARAERALVEQVWPPPAWQRVLARRRRRSLAATGVALTVIAALVWAVVRPALQEQPVVRPVPKVRPRLPAAGRVVATIGIREGPAAVTAGGGVLWAASSGDGTVVRIDPATGRATATVRLGGQVDGLVVAGGVLWVAYADRAVVTRVDSATTRIVGEVPVGRHAPVGTDPGTMSLPESVGVGLGAVWVPNSADGTVSRIDPAAAAVTATIPVSGRNPSVHLGTAGVGVAVAGGAVWVTDEYHDRLLRLDPGTGRITQVVELGGRPLPIRAAAGRLWVATTSDRRLYGLDPGTGRVTSTVSLGPGAAAPGFGEQPLTTGLAVSGQTAWATTTVEHRRVLVRVDLRTGRVAGELPLPGRVLGLVLVGGDPWLADYDNNTILHVVPTR
jgi:DNA-binding beta-propeller fold protein YncE